MDKNASDFSEIVRRADLESIRTLRFSAHTMNREKFDAQTVNVALRDRTRWNVGPERERVVAEVDFEFQVSDGEHDNPVDYFTAVVTYELSYGFSSALTEDDDVDQALKLFVETSARFHAWPYLREYLNYALSHSDLPSVTLPLLKPFARPDQRQGVQENPSIQN